MQTLASSLLLGRPFGSQIAGYSLAAGDDSNELGGCRSDPGVRRPLHYAIDFSAQRGHREFKRNFPVVELLLEDGADPRLLGHTITLFGNRGTRIMAEVLRRRPVPGNGRT